MLCQCVPTGVVKDRANETATASSWEWATTEPSNGEGWKVKEEARRYRRLGRGKATPSRNVFDGRCSQGCSQYGRRSVTGTARSLSGYPTSGYHVELEAA